MTAELSQYDLITLIISLIAVIMSLVAFINARQHAIIESFISMVNAFFTEDTRNARRVLRENKILTELRDEDEEDPNILVKKVVLSDKEIKNLWELVSAYNRLGFVLHNYPRIFLLLSLKTKFLKWDGETVIDMWKRVRLYVYKERIVDLARSEVGEEFEWLFNEAVRYQKRKNRNRWFKPNIIGWIKARKQARTVFRYHQKIKALYNDGKKLKSLYNDGKIKLQHTKDLDDLYELIANDHANKKISDQQYVSLKNKTSALYSQIYNNEIDSLKISDKNISMQLDLIKKKITDAHSEEKINALHHDSLNKNIADYDKNQNTKVA